MTGHGLRTPRSVPFRCRRGTPRRAKPNSRRWPISGVVGGPIREVASGMSGRTVGEALDRVLDGAAPRWITVDRGSEVRVARARKLGDRRPVQLYFVRPGKSVEKARIESFNGRLRNECLKLDQFASLEDARKRIGAWRRGPQPASTAQLARPPDAERVRPRTPSTPPAPLKTVSETVQLHRIAHR